MIAVLRLVSWNNPVVSNLGGVSTLVQFSITGPGIGYLPVYETMEEAAKDYPEGPFITVRFDEVGAA